MSKRSNPPDKNPNANDGAGSLLSSVSGPSSGITPDQLGGNEISERLLEKAKTGQDLAAAVTHNKNKNLEYGEQSYTPQKGATVAPELPSTTASTSSEIISSAKSGSGDPLIGFNAISDSLDRVRVDSGGRVLTTNQGVPIADNQHSLKAGLRGPSLLEDFILREKLTHFDHERIPERVVHARGSAAHGYFEAYKSLAEHTRATVFAEAGKRTPVFVRFSTVAGERGSADTARDARGFAVKFYTDEGNWDLVGNNIPVFFIQDAMKFPDLVHALKPEPHHGIPQASSAHDTFWDFVSLVPESTHMLLWVMSDRAIPRSYRTMQGFGVHSFRLVNAAGESVFCKFHWTPLAGTRSLVWDEAVALSGADPDFHRRDLWEAIESGSFPEWELGLQIFTEEQAANFPFDILDPTKIVPEEFVPITPVGKLVLNRNPDNFFAETEQVAFCTAHIIPGIDFSNDPLLQGRIHSYVDTQLTRLGGPNFHEIPINTPVPQAHNNQRDGIHRQAVHRGRVSYEPNSLGGGCPFQAGLSPTGVSGFSSFPEPIAEDKVRGNPELFADHYSQAKLFWDSQTPVEKRHITSAFRFELTRIQHPAIRRRVVSQLRNVDEKLAGQLATELGLDLPEPMPKASNLPLYHYAPSPALSLFSHPNSEGIKTRKIAILIAHGADTSAVRETYSALLSEGAVPRLVGSNLGKVNGSNGELDVEISLEAGPSVIYDAVIIADGEASVATLAKDAHALDFVRQQYRHGKTIWAPGHATLLLAQAGINTNLSANPSANLSKNQADRGIIGSDLDAKAALEKFITAVSGERVYERETYPPQV